MSPTYLSKYRQQLLSKVHSEILQLRSQSLHHAISQELASQPVEKTRPWDINIKVGKKPSTLLPSHLSVSDVFDEMGGKLLILGIDGGGKTSTLLELALNLCDRSPTSRYQSDYAIPILLDLQTYSEVSTTTTEKSKNFVKWLTNQLLEKYEIPAVITKLLLEQKQLIPLLDNFDQVNPAEIESCLQSINQFVSNSHPPHLVVCSNFQAYKNCQGRFRLNAALALHPLNLEQVQEYLLYARSRELWYAIKSEPELLKLAQIPFYLNLMTLAYEEILIASWRRIDNIEDQKKYLFNAFVRRQLNKDNYAKIYPTHQQILPEKTRHFLSQLACHINHTTPNFNVKNISPQWLNIPKKIQFYQISIKLLSMILWAILFSCLVNLISGMPWAWIALLIGLCFGWFTAFPGIPRLSLHFILWQQGDIPWNYQKFLNYSNTRLFLAKNDKNYQFIHRLLQNHFAELFQPKSHQ